MDITRFSVRKVGSSAINIPADIRDWLYEKGVQPNQKLYVASVNGGESFPSFIALFKTPEEYVEFKKRIEFVVGAGVVRYPFNSDDNHKRKPHRPFGTQYYKNAHTCAVLPECANENACITRTSTGPTS